MRIAIIRRRIHPHGGVEGYALRLIHGLKKRGIDVTVLAEEYDGSAGACPKQKLGVWNLPVRVLTPARACPVPLGKVSVPFFCPFSFNRSCQKILAREKFDIVHSLERTWPQDIYRAGEGCHAEFMKTLSLKDGLNPKHFFTLYAEKKAFSSSRYIMANSNRVKKEIITHYGIPEDRIVVIYTGVDTERFTPEKMGVPNFSKELTILFIGSGFKRKGLKLLIKALARVKNGDNALFFKLLVAGKGKVAPYLKLATSLGLKDKVKFLGLVKDIDSLYARADLLVLPSLYEPFSNSVLEAMACGIPVLTTRCNGVSEILEDGLKELIIEDPFDIEEMARKIMALTSKNTRESLSPKVRELAQKFSFSSHLEEVLKLYERVT